MNRNQEEEDDEETGRAGVLFLDLSGVTSTSAVKAGRRRSGGGVSLWWWCMNVNWNKSYNREGPGRKGLQLLND